MTRLFRYAVLFSLLICFAVAAPADAQSPGCQQLLKHGVYKGPSHITMVVRGIEGGVVLQELTFTETGQTSLTIECTVTSGTSHWNIQRTIRLVPGVPPVVCDSTLDLSQPSGTVVVGANGQPRIDVRWGQGIITSSTCTSPGPADTGATWRLSLSGPPQDRTIGGDFRVDPDDPDGMDAEDMAEMYRRQGYQVTLNKGWTLTRLPQPEVQNLNADLRQFFLAGIPVTNRYRAAIDWDKALPGTARFIVGNEAPLPMTVTGNTATVDLPLESVQGTGDIPLSVEAELGGRVHRLDNLGPLTLVPVPAWARPFNLQAQVQGAEVRYNGIFSVPSKPLDAHVVLPADLPFIGGVWGLLPTQFRLALAASSLGTREPGGLSAQGGFGLGQRTHTLAASGKIFGTLTHDTLNFESDELTLSTPRISFQQRIGLASLLPDVKQLVRDPVVGSAVETFVSLTSVTADIHGSMTGRGRLGVRGDELALTSGSFDALLGVGLTAGPNNGIIAAMLSGAVDGSLKMQIVPTVEVLACRIHLFFAARFQFLGFLGLPAAETNRTATLNSCGAAAAQGVKGVPSPRALEADIASVSPDAVLIELSLSAGQITNGLTETVLAENANPQARPALVAGPGSRLALVWTSASGAAEAVSVRLFDGAVWSNVLIVSQAGRPAVMPGAAFTANGKLMVAWAEAQSAPDPAGLTVGFVRSLDIAWAEVDPATNQVVRRGLVVSDTIMDFAPRLSQAADGTVWLAWQSSPGTDLVGAAALPNQWKAAAWTGSGWTATETVGENGVGILFWEMAAFDTNRVWVVADVDVDGDLGTASDREVYIYKRTVAGWAAPYRLTHDAVIDSAPLLALTPDGQPVLAWRHGDGVMGLTGDPASTEPRPWFDASAGVGPMLGAGRLLAGAGGALTLLWSDTTARGQDVWLSRFNSVTGVWSLPAPLFHSAEVRRAPSAMLMPGGDILLGLAAMPVTSETVTFADGSTAQVPAVGNAARLLVARIPAGYIPVPENEALFLFLPLVAR